MPVSADSPRDPDPSIFRRDRPVSTWIEELSKSAAAGGDDAELLTAILRFSRPDLSPILGPRSLARRNREAFLSRFLSDELDESLARVLSWWLPNELGRNRGISAPPPLPAFGSARSPLAVLRENWLPEGSWAAVDHRDPRSPALFEAAWKGRPMILGDWTSVAGEPPARPIKTPIWSTGPYADHYEWSFRVGPVKVTRTLVNLRGASSLLIAEENGGPPAPEGFRLALADGVRSESPTDLRAIRLQTSKSGSRGFIVPLGLPRLPYETDKGRLDIGDDFVGIRRDREEKRGWTPLLVCWGDPPETWRRLTVAERSSAVPSHAAFAARFAWKGRSDGLVVYRSLAKPALRSFLGYQTSARFLIGKFTSGGDVTPILKVDA